MIKVGPAGSSGLGNLKGVSKCAEMGLDCMEVEFTYGVRMDLKTAKAVGTLAREKGILLSVHAPYYINKKLPQKFHAHFSGIEYGPKGERKHIRTTEKFFEPLASELVKCNPDITIINESPKPYEDAVMMKKVIQILITVNK